MSKGTTRRTVRIEDGLWQEAQEKAADRGDNLSDIIRRALASYINERPQSEHQ
jgi:metal-responsive CopG/Arc/MetJ family transcriptional regulator